jgi:NAD-dependent dihydropyrimidine dehydrogenase PreA subunit
MTIFYFTASGNSLAVAKSLCDHTLSIPRFLKGEKRTYSDDAIGIVFPCYVGSLPTVVERFLEQVRLEAPYIFGIMTYGSFCLGAASFSDCARKKGLKISYTNTVKMVDNSLKFYDMEKEIAGIPGKGTDGRIVKIREDLQRRRKRRAPFERIAGLVSRLGYRAYRREIGDVDRLFSVESSCNGCRVCEQACPVDNIAFGEEKPAFAGHCIRCYACTHNCPQNAIRLEGEKSRARYRHPDVGLGEIVRANR